MNSEPTESETLDVLAQRFRADKGSHCHNYCGYYEQIFGPRRMEELTLMEIGVWEGASLCMWAEWFPRAKIVGIDKRTPTGAPMHERIKIVLADASDREQMGNIGKIYSPLHIIIDDGSHVCSDQIAAFETLFPLLEPNGIYVIEDIQVCSWLQFRGKEGTILDYLRDRIWDVQQHGENVHGEGPSHELSYWERSVESIQFFRGLGVIRKSPFVS